MQSRGEYVQVFYEIAMSIGSSFDLDKMAKDALFAYTRKLSCCSGIILKSHKLTSGKGHGFDFIFSIPRINTQQVLLEDAMELAEDYLNFPAQKTDLPLVRESIDSLYSHTMLLPKYGLIVLFKNEEPLEQYILRSLGPLNRKLASFCLACESKQSLVESEAKYRRIFESIHDIYTEIDFDTGVIQEISPSVALTLGYSREELIGTSSRYLYVNEHERIALKEILLLKGKVGDFELRARTRHNQEKVVSFSVHIEQDPITGRRSVVGTMRDISRRKKAEEALLKSRDQLEEIVEQRTAKLNQTNESLKAEIRERIEAEKNLKQTQAKLIQSEKLASVGQLSSGIAHEINTPIQYIGTHLRFLEESYATLSQFVKKMESGLQGMENMDSGEIVNEIREALSVMDFPYLKKSLPESLIHAIEGVDQISSIVKGMNLFAHSSVDEKSMNSINEIVENVLKISRSEWKDNIQIVCNLDAELQEVWCVRHAIAQVLLNLVLNAVHAIEEKTEKSPGFEGRITIDTFMQNAYIVICLKDNGVGIPEEWINRIFEPFFTTKPPGKGTGQGLAIAYAIIASEHKGSIEVKSDPKGWTEFRVTIPVSYLNASK